MISRKIVLPGDLVSTNPKAAGPGTYVENGKVYARVLGLLDKTDLGVRIIPLKGRYIPSIGDTVIGIVKEVTANGWIVNINSPYMAFLPILENPAMRPDRRPNDTRQSAFTSANGHCAVMCWNFSNRSIFITLWQLFDSLFIAAILKSNQRHMDHS